VKKETPDLMKFKRLQRKLKVSVPELCGLLELLWICAQKNAPRGDIGKFSNEEIAIACYYEGDPDEFVQALIDTTWLDTHKEYRLIVHDWADHAPRWVLGNLSRHGKSVIHSDSAEDETQIDANDVDFSTEQPTKQATKESTEQPTKKATKQATRKPPPSLAQSSLAQPSLAREKKAAEQQTNSHTLPGISLEGYSNPIESTAEHDEGNQASSESASLESTPGALKQKSKKVIKEDDEIRGAYRSKEFGEVWRCWKNHLGEIFCPLNPTAEDAVLMDLHRCWPEERDAIEIVRFSIIKRAKNLITNGDHKKKNKENGEILDRRTEANKQLFNSIFGE